jgi:hypothetical protein
MAGIGTALVPLQLRAVTPPAWLLLNLPPSCICRRPHMRKETRSLESRSSVEKIDQSPASEYSNRPVVLSQIASLIDGNQRTFLRKQICLPEEIVTTFWPTIPVEIDCADRVSTDLTRPRLRTRYRPKHQLFTQPAGATHKRPYVIADSRCRKTRPGTD